MGVSIKLDAAGHPTNGSLPPVSHWATYAPGHGWHTHATLAACKSSLTNTIIDKRTGKARHSGFVYQAGVVLVRSQPEIAWIQRFAVLQGSSKDQHVLWMSPKAQKAHQARQDALMPLPGEILIVGTCSLCLTDTADLKGWTRGTNGLLCPTCTLVHEAVPELGVT